MSKYGVFSGPYFTVFSPNGGKCGSVKTSSLDPFHAVKDFYKFVRFSIYDWGKCKVFAATFVKLWLIIGNSFIASIFEHTNRPNFGSPLLFKIFIPTILALIHHTSLFTPIIAPLRCFFSGDFTSLRKMLK